MRPIDARARLEKHLGENVGYWKAHRERTEERALSEFDAGF
jgi:hypothetical protein